MSGALEAGLWGLLAGGALLLGASIAYVVELPKRVIAGAMAFGSGVLISALAFDLMDDAYERGGLLAASGGFALGVVAYSVANWLLAMRGAKHRKRSGGQQPSEGDVGGSGTAIAVGSLIDGIPESMAIGASLLGNEGVSLVAVAAIFLSNVPEGLSSSAGMKCAGRSAGFVFSIWAGIAVVCGLSAYVGYVLFVAASGGLAAMAIAVAAGAILAMVVDTMIPEAFAEAHDFAGLIAGAGFLVAFALSRAF